MWNFFKDANPMEVANNIVGTNVPAQALPSVAGIEAVQPLASAAIPVVPAIAENQPHPIPVVPVAENQTQVPVVLEVSTVAEKAPGMLAQAYSTLVNNPGKTALGVALAAGLSGVGYWLSREPKIDPKKVFTRTYVFFAAKDEVLEALSSLSPKKHAAIIHNLNTEKYAIPFSMLPPFELAHFAESTVPDQVTFLEQILTRKAQLNVAAQQEGRLGDALAALNPMALANQLVGVPSVLAEPVVDAAAEKAAAEKAAAEKVAAEKAAAAKPASVIAPVAPMKPLKPAAANEVGPIATTPKAAAPLKPVPVAKPAAAKQAPVKPEVAVQRAQEQRAAEKAAAEKAAAEKAAAEKAAAEKAAAEKAAAEKAAAEKAAAEKAAAEKAAAEKAAAEKAAAEKAAAEKAAAEKAAAEKAAAEKPAAPVLFTPVAAAAAAARPAPAVLSVVVAAPALNNEILNNINRIADDKRKVLAVQHFKNVALKPEAIELLNANPEKAAMLLAQDEVTVKRFQAAPTLGHQKLMINNRLPHIITFKKPEGPRM